nr:efflux RND transporter periplasmic adaptor subunit [Gammaproteobacteria bacterium]
MPRTLPLALALLLAACGNGDQIQKSVRPVMVVQPEPAVESVEAFP